MKTFFTAFALTLASAATLQAQDTTQSWLETTVFGLTMGQMLSSLGILLVAILLRGVITKILFQRLKELAAKTKMEFDDDILRAMEKPMSLFLLIFGIYLAAAKLPWTSQVDMILWNLFKGGTMLTIVWAIMRLVDVFGDLLGYAAKDKDSAIHGFIPLIKKTLRIFITVIGILLVIDNLGYNVSSIIAALGLGGAALALASKDTIANLFGSLMIVLDRPFKVGDWIQVGSKVDGDVEAIGLRSTKVRTWPKTIISIPNSILANEYINNWSRMPKRRVKQYIGVTYEATPEQMEAVVQAIRTLLNEDEGVQQDFILVNFTDFGGSSLDILVYYFTTTTAWLQHMDVRQRVNIKIMKAIRDCGLSIAFPTRSLYFEGEVARKMAGMPLDPHDPDTLPKGGFGGGSGHGSSGLDQPPHLGGGGEGSGRLPGDFGPTEPI